MLIADALAVSCTMNFSSEEIAGKIFSVHNDYANILTDTGMITLFREGSPSVPFGVRVKLFGSWPEAGLRKNQSAVFASGQLTVEDTLAIRGLADCRQFSSRPGAALVFDAPELAERLDRLYEICQYSPKDGGILNYFRHFRLQAGRSWHPTAGGVFEKRIQQRLEALVTGIRQNDDYLIVEGVYGLLGVGPGLTPSGDDFLLGFLTGLTSAHLGYHKMATAKLALYMAQNAPVRTTALSAEYISYAARGLYHEYVVNLVDAFRAGQQSLMVTAAERLLSLGEFSGTDLLLGFVHGGSCALSVSERGGRVNANL